MGAVKKYNVKRLETYLEDLRKRKISIEEVAKRVNYQRLKSLACNQERDSRATTLLLLLHLASREC